MEQESLIRQREMQIQHEFDLQLKKMEVDAMRNKEQYIEDRKDKRTKMEGTQQSKMIEQRKLNLMPTNFEKTSPGNNMPPAV